MFLDFTEELLPRKPYMQKCMRHKVCGGWYVRILFTEFGLNKKTGSESAIFLSDPEHAWNIENFKWELIKKEQSGGVYRAKIAGGWIVAATTRGLAESDSGRVYIRTGSLVFILDSAGDWECKILEEKYEIFKV